MLCQRASPGEYKEETPSRRRSAKRAIAKANAEVAVVGVEKELSRASRVGAVIRQQQDRTGNCVTNGSHLPLAIKRLLPTKLIAAVRSVRDLARIIPNMIAIGNVEHSLPQRIEILHECGKSRDIGFLFRGRFFQARSLEARAHPRRQPKPAERHPASRSTATTERNSTGMPADFHSLAKRPAIDRLLFPREAHRPSVLSLCPRRCQKSAQDSLIARCRSQMSRGEHTQAVAASIKGATNAKHSLPQNGVTFAGEVAESRIGRSHRSFAGNHAPPRVSRYGD